MNIGLFSDSYYPLINGVTTSISTLAKHLEDLGHNVYIFAPNAPDIPDEKARVKRMLSIPCIFVKNARVGISYSPLELAKIAQLNLDIVHTQTEFPLGVFGKMFSKTMNIPMVHTYHTMYEDYVHYIVNGAIISPSMAKEYSKIFCNYANAVIAPTEKVKNILSEYGVTKPISVIPTGISIDHFRKSNYNKEEILKLRESLGISKNHHVVLSLGRVAKEKSIDVIINAFPELLKKMPDAKLVIVGDGPVKEDLEKLAETLNITSSVIFTGAKKYEEIGKYYQLGDVFASASITETQGLTFAEAMAAGLPVVAKKDPSIEGIVNDNETGLLFETDDQLGDKLYEILNDQAMHKRISKTSMDFIENLSAEAFAENVESLYFDILKNSDKYDFHRHFNILNVNSRRKAVKGIRRFNRNITYNIYRPKRLFKLIKKKTTQWYNLELSNFNNMENRILNKNNNKN